MAVNIIDTPIIFIFIIIRYNANKLEFEELLCLCQRQLIHKNLASLNFFIGNPKIILRKFEKLEKKKCEQYLKTIQEYELKIMRIGKSYSSTLSLDYKIDKDTYLIIKDTY